VIGLDEVEHFEQLLRRWIDEGWNAQNLQVIGEIFSEDYEATGGLSNLVGDIHGHDGLSEYAQRTFDAFSDLKVAIREIHVCGNIAMLAYHFTGTHTGSLIGEKPTGNTLDMKSVDVFQYCDGKIIKRLVAHHDANLLNNQLGL